STDGMTWTEATAAAAWSARGYHTSAVHDGKMWVIAGLDESNENDVYYTCSGSVINTTGSLFCNATVQFSTVLTYYPLPTYNWTFGDGQTGSGATPSHIYTTPGTYTVTLTVPDAVNGIQTVTYTQEIQIAEDVVAPIANFTANTITGTVPMTVQFTDTSTENPTGWSWDFGDGQTSTAQHPSHTYTAAGTYTVTLNASNAYGSDTETKTGLVTVSASGPHHVATYADLCKVGTGVDGWTLDASYVQTADIQCPTGAERTGFTPIGEEYTPFEGTYDGGGYAIRDLYVNQDDYHYDAGLFGRVGGGAQIIGVTLTDPVVYGFTEAGGLIGYAEGTAASHITVTNCYVVRGTVYAESDCGGGLIGLAKYVDLQSCTTSGALPTWCGYLSGGMVGQMNSGSMTDCHSSMSVQPGYGGIGGLIGSLFDTCTITQCSATGQVSGSEVNPSGGLIGNIYTNGDAVVTITECFASGDLDIQLREEVGGFIGSVKGGYMTSLLVDITDCYTRGTIGPLTGSGSNSGGFIGRSDNNKVTLTRCYSSRTITTPDKADGFIGRIWTSAVETYTCFWDVGTAGKTTSIAVGVIGKTTIEMKTLATFTSWNIATPTASFTATPASGTTPLTVRFTDTSTGSPLAWSWSFDDGTTSTAQHPTHTYTNPGIYSVTLTVANAHGSNTYTKIRTVVAQNPPIPIKPVITSPTYNTTIQYDMANGTYLQYWLYNVTTFGDIPIYGFAYGIMAPLMNVWGYWTFVIIWLAYLFIVWIRTSDIGLPIVIGLLTAGVWGIFFPPEAMQFAILMFGIAIAALFAKLAIEYI
ncbi:MAG: PKD domain-containing protein, partial [candidate division Zixibacteria bacterium]|nr:PKD domain-containing protein [candidate division Zixibacteria bacterium]